MKIYDEYTTLNLSRQRKYQLRHPDREAQRVQRWKNPRRGKHRGGSEMPNTEQSKSSYPHRRLRKTLDTKNRERIIKASQFLRLVTLQAEWPLGAEMSHPSSTGKIGWRTL